MTGPKGSRNKVSSYSRSKRMGMATRRMEGTRAMKAMGQPMAARKDTSVSGIDPIKWASSVFDHFRGKN